VTSLDSVRRRVGGISFGLALCASACLTSCEVAPGRAARPSLDQQLTPTSNVPPRDGLAAAILIDVSGSMEQRVAAEGAGERKIEIARRVVHDLVAEFGRYASDHPTEPVMLGIYEFSRRDDRPDLRQLLPMSVVNRTATLGNLSRVVADGGTPIGSAMIAAKHQLDATGLSRRHLLVVTDGENTHGVRPEEVTAAIGRRAEAERPSIYLVAFDVDASQFNRVRDAGALVMAAGDAKQLTETLDGLLRGKILVEQ
jgi:von Willebrand factor type A domain